MDAIDYRALVQDDRIHASLAKREMHWWIGRTTHRLRRVDGRLRMCRKKVVLVNAAEPLPNLSFLI